MISAILFSNPSLLSIGEGQIAAIGAELDLLHVHFRRCRFAPSSFCAGVMSLKSVWAKAGGKNAEDLRSARSRSRRHGCSSLEPLNLDTKNKRPLTHTGCARGLQLGAANQYSRNVKSVPPCGIMGRPVAFAMAVAPIAPNLSLMSRPAVTGRPIQPPMPLHTDTYCLPSIL